MADTLVTHYSYLWTDDMGAEPPVLRAHLVIVRGSRFVPGKGHHLPGMRSWLPTKELRTTPAEAAKHYALISGEICKNMERKLRLRQASVDAVIGAKP